MPESVESPTVNPLLAIDERNDVHQSIAKAKAELQRIETDITILLERQEAAMNNLAQLKKTLVIHLPGEIIGDIFSILPAERISFPHKRMTPPQITVSHVCSKWREIALSIPALWNNIEIAEPDDDHWVQVATELLFNRTGRRGVTLALNMEEVGSEDLGNTFYDIVLPLHVKELHLTLRSLSDLNHLLRDSYDIVANIDEIALKITEFTEAQVSNASQFFSKIRSLICVESSFFQHQSLPWAQMRYLNTSNSDLSVSTVSNILRHSPLLEACEIGVELDDEAEDDFDDAVDAVELDSRAADDAVEMFALPHLRVFNISISSNRGSPRRSLDVFLQSFKCPSLTELSLEIPCWTRGMYNTIQTNYNLHRLIKLKLTNYPYPISKILHDAPGLQELIITRKFIFMDESAIHAVSSGKLGRCLTSLGLKGEFDVRGVLDMIAARQRCVKQIVEAGHGWQDQISGIKQIFLSDDDEEMFKEEVDELKKLGTDVYHSLDSDSDSE